MTQLPDVRRHPDGSIDFDFYGRRASRRRQRARRLVFVRYLRTIGGAGETVLTAIRKLKPRPEDLRVLGKFSHTTEGLS
jgi:hypothetical protein